MMHTIQSGLITIYISDTVQMVNSAVTGQDVDVDVHIREPPDERVSETTQRKRYKQSRMNSYNKDKGLMLRHTDVRTFHT